ncbi:MAG: rRNA adenine N-6-methyltransferase family protein, partial [Desulforhopalus sp.]
MSNYGRNAFEALKSNKLAPKKRFGQNFLVHRQTAEAIVRAGGVTADDIILEVGVGLGALTIPLALVAKHVYGYEIDSGIIRFHKEQKDLPKNVSLVHQDILKADFQDIANKCGGKLKILAN